MNHPCRALRRAIVAGIALTFIHLSGSVAAGSLSLEDAQALRAEAGTAQEALGRALPKVDDPEALKAAQAAERSL